MFDGDTEFLDKNSLLEGFNLSKQNTDINFSLSGSKIYTVDIKLQGDSVRKYRKVLQNESDYINNLLKRATPEEKIKHYMKKQFYK